MGDGRSKKKPRSTTKAQARSPSSTTSAATSNSAVQQAITGEIVLATPTEDAVQVTVRGVKGAPSKGLEEGTPVLSKVAGLGTGRVERPIAGGFKGVFDDVSLIPQEATRMLQDRPEVTLHPDGVPQREAPPGSQIPAEEIQAVPITEDFVREVHAAREAEQAELDAAMQAEQDAHNQGRAGDDAAEAQRAWEEQQAYEAEMEDKVH